jgi:hypothetical protein
MKKKILTNFMSIFFKAEPKDNKMDFDGTVKAAEWYHFWIDTIAA